MESLFIQIIIKTINPSFVLHGHILYILIWNL